MPACRPWLLTAGLVRDGVQGGHTAGASLGFGEGEVQCRRGRSLPVERHDNGPDAGRGQAPRAGDDHHRTVGMGGYRRGHRSAEKLISEVKVMAADDHEGRSFSHPVQQRDRRGQLDQRAHLHRRRDGQLGDDIAHDLVGGVSGGRNGLRGQIIGDHRHLVGAHHQHVEVARAGGLDRRSGRHRRLPVSRPPPRRPSREH